MWGLERAVCCSLCTHALLCTQVAKRPLAMLVLVLFLRRGWFLQKIAIAAEVEENTLANAAPLARRALRDVLA